MHRLISIGACLALASACASTTKIISDPPGATVLDETGQELGTTPYEYTGKKGTVFDVETLQVEKAGYRPASIKLERSRIESTRRTRLGIGRGN